MFGRFFIDVSTLMVKNRPKMTVCSSFKVSNIKIVSDHGDLENKVKVKLMMCNTKSCHNAS